MKQDDRVLDYLKKNEYIDPMTSWAQLGVYRLSAVILRLRQAGHNIETTLKTVKNRFGEKCRVANYVLHQDQPDV